MSLEHKKKQMELKRVVLAREELDLKVEEKIAEISRLKEAIKIQETTEVRLENEIKEMEKK